MSILSPSLNELQALAPRIDAVAIADSEYDPELGPVADDKAKARQYCFTLWFKDDTPSHHLALHPSCAYLVYQEEIGKKCGRRHLQGYVEFAIPKRIKTIKKMGRGWDTMHLRMKYVLATPLQASNYCKKEDTRVLDGLSYEFGTLSMTGVKRSYTVMMECLKAGTFNKEEHLGDYIRHKRAIDEYLYEKGLMLPSEIEIDFDETKLFDWQLEILELIKGKPHKRKAYWIYDEHGGGGKTEFTNYLIKHHKAIHIDTTNRERVIRAYNREPIICFDVTRAEGKRDHVNYGIIETMQGGHGFNTMYNPGMKLWKCPHIFILSNFRPTLDEMSKGRILVTDITGRPGGRPIPGFAEAAAVPVASNDFGLMSYFLG